MKNTITKRLLGFVCALSLVLTVAPQTTFADTWDNVHVDDTVWMRIGDTYSLKRFFTSNELSNASSVDVGAIEKSVISDAGTSIKAEKAGRSYVNIKCKKSGSLLPITKTLDVHVLPKDTSNVKFSRDGYMLLKSKALSESNKYRRSQYTVTFYNGSVPVSTKTVSVKYSGINTAWLRVATPGSYTYTKVSVKAKYGDTKAIPSTGNLSALRSDINVGSAYMQDNNKVAVVKITSKLYNTRYIPVVTYTTWLENSAGDVLKVKVNKFSATLNKTYNKGVRFSLLTNYDDVTICSSPLITNVYSAQQ